MNPAKPTDIAIIGAGASGMLLAVQLCRQAGQGPLRITLFDKNPVPGPGLAYASQEPLHLLNVPVARISAFPDEPDHFLNWLQQNGFAPAPADFAPRQVYGQYLNQIFRQTIAQLPPQLSVKFMQEEVVQLERQPQSLNLRTVTGAVFSAKKVVLALGNFPPGHPCQALAELAGTAAYAPNPWAQHLFRNLPLQATVLLVGTGLTMVDMLMSLHSRGHKGAVVAVSTHGHLPTAHAATPAYTGVSEEVAKLACVKEWLVYIRRHMKQAAESGADWRAVIDAFRPYSQQFWLQLSLTEKRRFMRHLRHLWAVSRHRMAPANALVLEEMLQKGQLRIVAGRMQKATLLNGQVHATIRESKTGTQQKITADLVVNCTGPEADVRKVRLPLLQNLLAQGLVIPDALHMGFAATPQGELVNKVHQVSDQLYTLGPPMKGVLWESTAIPEIREQAQKLAQLLLHNS